MSGSAPADDFSRTTRIIRWIGLSVTTLLVIGCLLGGAWLLFPVLFPQIWANYLSHVQGQAELIVSAQQQFDTGSLSPDGRWIVWKPLQERREEQSPIILDLVAEQRHPLTDDLREMRWLNSDQFVVLTSADTYYLLDIHTFTKVPIPIFPEKEGRAKHKIDVVQRRPFPNRRRSPSRNRLRSCISRRRPPTRAQLTSRRSCPATPDLIRRRCVFPPVVAWKRQHPPTTCGRQCHATRFYRPVQPAARRPPAPAGLSAHPARRPVPAYPSPCAAAGLGG